MSDHVDARLPVRSARVDEFASLTAVEDAADLLFAEAGLGPLPPPAGPEQFPDALAVLVAGDPPVGFARLELVDDAVHLEQLSVHPSHGRRGIGSELLAAACRWAADHGHTAVTLCTFADIPWNGPFYARHGFVFLSEPELTPGLMELRGREAELGLDTLGRRTVMRKLLTDPDPRSQPLGSSL
jgi:GNAT superfamily N-acetyltransferase